jgi:hypothetical protein
MTSFEIPDGPTTVAMTTRTVAGKPMQVATLTFTVTNRTTERLSCRLKVAPQGDAQAEWFEVQGEKERPFAPSETQKVTVSVTAPAEVKTGDFKLRLQAMNVNDPGNDFAESAVATLSVSTASPKKAAVWPYILVAVALVLIVGVVAFLLLSHHDGATNAPANTATNQAATNSLAPVPDVSSSRSVSFESAFQTLTAAGFTVAPTVGKTVSPTGPYNVVVSQYPLARTPEPPNTVVTLTMQVSADGASVVQTYVEPQIDVAGSGSVALDWCLSWATNCGKPAAEAFCRSKDPGKPWVADFQIHQASGRTAIFSDHRICEPTCDSFHHITCSASPP